MLTEIYEGFTITLEAVQSDQSIAELYAGSEATSYSVGELEAAVDIGDMLHFRAKVTCSRGGIVLSCEYLDGCIYDTLEDFKNNSDYYADMRATVLHDARAAIIALHREDA